MIIPPPATITADAAPQSRQTVVLGRVLSQNPLSVEPLAQRNNSETDAAVAAYLAADDSFSDPCWLYGPPCTLLLLVGLAIAFALSRDTTVLIVLIVCCVFCGMCAVRKACTA